MVPKSSEKWFTLWMAQRVCTPPTASAKPRYRVTNWRDYNRALVERGSLTLWIDEEVLDGWPPRSGKLSPHLMQKVYAEAGGTG